MKFKKLRNTQDRTGKIILSKDGVYISFTPRQAAEAINMLKRSLWTGISLNR